MTEAELDILANRKVKEFSAFLKAEPPDVNGDQLYEMWKGIYDDTVKSVEVETVTGVSDGSNPVFPYEKLCALMEGKGTWKWPRMWHNLDQLERRGSAYRDGEALNFDMPNKNPNLVPVKVLVVGGGPVGLRMAIELVLGGHKVTVVEKRREIKIDGALQELGFTNRINRPHMWQFVRNDLKKFNGKDFMSRDACYPVFTQPETSSIGIDELQILLLKNALLLGVDFRLGVGYDNATIQVDPETCRPTWCVDNIYDEQAAEEFGVQVGPNKEVFDVLLGCDGARSRVRDTQKALGEIEKRKFMDCTAVVVNVRKVSRKRLRELGFKDGLEPQDISRTFQKFRPWFEGIKKQTGADLENLIYYKASHHNYCIITPKRSALQALGLAQNVMSFDKARSTPNPAKVEEKRKLMEFSLSVIKAAGIPIDEELPNGGFVDAPNDCMAFDFAECWNTKQSMAFNVAPLEYTVSEHGNWKGSKLIPLVGLAGDSLLEPFWPLGLGLKRGWQAIMDCCYAIDNLYNKGCFSEKLGKDPNEITFAEHQEQLREQTELNFKYCDAQRSTEELGKGEYAEKGAEMTLFRKLTQSKGDLETPTLEIEIDPWTRYAPLKKACGDSWKYGSEENEEDIPPVVRRHLHKLAYMENFTKKDGTLNHVAKKLQACDGKTVSRPEAVAPDDAPVASSPTRMSISTHEIEHKANSQKSKLVSALISSQMEGHVAKSRQSVTTHHDFLMEPTGHADQGAQASAEAMWERAHETHLTPLQRAELDQIRFQIDALYKSIESYKKAERALLQGTSK